MVHISIPRNSRFCHTVLRVLTRFLLLGKPRAGAAGARPCGERRRGDSVEVRAVTLLDPLLPRYFEHFPNFITRMFHQRLSVEKFLTIDLRDIKSHTVNKCTSRMEWGRGKSGDGRSADNRTGGTIDSPRSVISEEPRTDNAASCRRSRIRFRARRGWNPPLAWACSWKSRGTSTPIRVCWRVERADSPTTPKFDFSILIN